MLDSTFGTGGKLTVDFFGAGDQAVCVAVDPNGRIVVAGSARNANLTVLGRSESRILRETMRPTVAARCAGITPRDVAIRFDGHADDPCGLGVSLRLRGCARPSQTPRWSHLPGAVVPAGKSIWSSPPTAPWKTTKPFSTRVTRCRYVLNNGISIELRPGDMSNFAFTESESQACHGHSFGLACNREDFCAATLFALPDQHNSALR